MEEGRVSKHTERIGCLHRTEIRYVLTWGLRGHHHKVQLGTNLGVNKINHTINAIFESHLKCL